jgi:hypothetical protein
MAITLALAALAVGLWTSNRSGPGRRSTRTEPKVPADLLRRVARGGRVMDHRAVIRFGLHDANETERTRRKVA